MFEIDSSVMRLELDYYLEKGFLKKTLNRTTINVDSDGNKLSHDEAFHVHLWGFLHIL